MISTGSCSGRRDRPPLLGRGCPLGKNPIRRNTAGSTARVSRPTSTGVARLPVGVRLVQRRPDRVEVAAGHPGHHGGAGLVPAGVRPVALADGEGVHREGRQRARDGDDHDDRASLGAAAGLEQARARDEPSPAQQPAPERTPGGTARWASRSPVSSAMSAGPASASGPCRLPLTNATTPVPTQATTNASTAPNAHRPEATGPLRTTSCRGSRAVRTAAASVVSTTATTARSTAAAKPGTGLEGATRPAAGAGRPPRRPGPPARPGPPRRGGRGAARGAAGRPPRPARDRGVAPRPPPRVARRSPQLSTSHSTKTESTAIGASSSGTVRWAWSTWARTLSVSSSTPVRSSRSVAAQVHGAGDLLDALAQRHHASTSAVVCPPVRRPARSRRSGWARRRRSARPSATRRGWRRARARA